MTTALATISVANAVTFEARAWLGEAPQACVAEASAAANGADCDATFIVPTGRLDCVVVPNGAANVLA